MSFESDPQSFWIAESRKQTQRSDQTGYFIFYH